MAQLTTVQRSRSFNSSFATRCWNSKKKSCFMFEHSCSRPLTCKWALPQNVTGNLRFLAAYVTSLFILHSSLIQVFSRGQNIGSCTTNESAHLGRYVRSPYSFPDWSIGPSRRVLHADLLL